jgi:hypothetical protein
MKPALKQFSFNSMRLLVGACGLFTILALTPAGVAQQAAPVQGSGVSAAAPAAPASINATGAVKPAATSAEEQEVTASGKPASEGIKVHGHWVLQVKNADGTLGERREFDNSLVTSGYVASGDQILAALLSGNAVAGDPGILLIQTSSAFPSDPSKYCVNSGQGIQCYMITTATSPITNTFILFNMTAIVSPSQNVLNTVVYFSPNVSWVLSGNFTVPSGLTSISAVQTILPLCASASSQLATNFGAGANKLSFTGSSGDLSGDLAPKGCAGNVTLTSTDSLNPAIFTSTQIPTSPLPVSATAGQIIQVTVTISFS